jgi:hypothetical protein
MPYSSSIQLVNDANGTAYAFLVEDGAIWQCQWNSEAQRWDKGQIVPGAFGGEKLQALLLPEFWTTANNGGTTGTDWDPAIVLAYRVGQGSGAEIQASFGRWDAQGQLGWSAPVRLTDDQSSDRHFALSAGDNHTLNLVVEKQVGAAPASAVLDGLANAAASDPTSLREQLIAATQGSQPDSDLYVNRYRVDSTGSQLEQLVSTNVPGGQWQAITNEANPLKPASTPPQFSQPAVSLSGNTQLLRSLLYSAQQPLAQAALVAPASAEQQASAGSSVAALGSADPAPRGSSFSAAWAPSFLRLDFTGKFGALDLGLKGQNIFRWVYEVGGPNESLVSLNDRYLSDRQVITLEFNPLAMGVDVVESKEFRELSRNLDQVTQGRIFETAARAYNGRGDFTYSIANPSVSATSAWNLKLQGGLGQA